jgi:hypothetical protein
LGELGFLKLDFELGTGSRERHTLPGLRETLSFEPKELLDESNGMFGGEKVN